MGVSFISNGLNVSYTINARPHRTDATMMYVCLVWLCLFDSLESEVKIYCSTDVHFFFRSDSLGSIDNLVDLQFNLIVGQINWQIDRVTNSRVYQIDRLSQ